jgi:NAD-dependent deacetylase
MDNIEKLKEIINNSKRIVVFTGAGVSTESGIKDFRGKDGISKYTDIPIEILISDDYFYGHTEEFYTYYKKCFNCLDKEPNITHKYLKKLEDEGKLIGIITQNVDGLHSKAGSKNVLEIHGTIYKNRCISCGKEYTPEYVFDSDGVPKCECGGIVKPDVVLYGEPLPEDAVFTASKLVREADTMIVLGTSLQVMPASGFVTSFSGENLVIINYDSTPYDKAADLVIHDKLSNVISKLEE